MSRELKVYLPSPVTHPNLQARTYRRNEVKRDMNEKLLPAEQLPLGLKGE